MKHGALRRQIVAACLEMNRRGLNQGMTGNISIRVPEGFLITPSGIAYDGHRSLYVSSKPKSVIFRIDVPSARVSVLAGVPSQPGVSDGYRRLSSTNEQDDLAKSGTPTGGHFSYKFQRC